MDKAFVHYAMLDLICKMGDVTKRLKIVKIS